MATAEQQRAWRLRRKALGLPTGGGAHNPEQQREYHNRPDVKRRALELKRIYSRDPAKRQRYLARLRCRAAIKAGKLKRGPCRDCGSAKTEAHHEDYNKPFEVVWLCSTCHVNLHNELRRTERP